MNPDIPHFLVEFKNPNASNVTASINQKIIINLVGAAKLMKKQTYPHLEMKKGKPYLHTFKCFTC